MIKDNELIIPFSLKDNNDELFNIIDNKGLTIIYFYSKDNTSACTKQALGYKELYNEFNKLNVSIYGISRDNIKTHQNFINKYELPFKLLYDENRIVTSNYSCLKEKNMYGKKVIGTLRSSFIIKDNIIIKANYNVKAEEDALNNLNFIKNMK